MYQNVNSGPQGCTIKFCIFVCLLIYGLWIFHESVYVQPVVESYVSYSFKGEKNDTFTHISKSMPVNLEGHPFLNLRNNYLMTLNS